MQRWVADESRNRMGRSVWLTCGVSARQDVEETVRRCSQQGAAACFSPLKSVSHYISEHAGDRRRCFSRFHKVRTPTYLTKKRHKMTRHTGWNISSHVSTSSFLMSELTFWYLVLPFVNGERRCLQSHKLSWNSEPKLGAKKTAVTTLAQAPDSPEQTEPTVTFYVKLWMISAHFSQRRLSEAKGKHIVCGAADSFERYKKYSLVINILSQSHLIKMSQKTTSMNHRHGPPPSPVSPPPPPALSLLYFIIQSAQFLFIYDGILAKKTLTNCKAHYFLLFELQAASAR